MSNSGKHLTHIKGILFCFQKFINTHTHTHIYIMVKNLLANKEDIRKGFDP